MMTEPNQINEPSSGDNSNLPMQHCLNIEIIKRFYFFGKRRLANHTIVFRNEVELINKLTFMEIKWGDRLDLNITLPQDVKVNDLPNYVGMTLFSIAHRPYFSREDIYYLDMPKPENTSSIVKMKTPEGLLTSSQRAQLDQILIQSRVTKLSQARALMWAVTSAVVAAFIFTVWGMGVIIGGLCGVFAAMFRDGALNLLSKKYNTPEKIAAVIHDEEKQALLNGLEAKTWTGYFLSWGSLTNYRHLRAFCAAEKYACEGHEGIVKEIKKFRPAA